MAFGVIFSATAFGSMMPPSASAGAQGAVPWQASLRRSKYDASFLFSEPRACLGAGSPSLTGRGFQPTNPEPQGDIAGNQSATATPSSWTVSLVVNPDPSVPCCGSGDAASVSSCMSIAKAAWLQDGDIGCDALCAEARGFFNSMETVNHLQIATMTFGAIATLMWMFGTLSYLLSDENGISKEPNCAAKFAFALWLVCNCSTIICQSIEVGFVSNGSLRQSAETIKDAACYNSEGAFGYNEITGNLRSTQILLWGEIFVSAMSLLIGIYSLTEVFGSKDAKVTPMFLETVRCRHLANLKFAKSHSFSRKCIIF